jgi:hypothetical protein
MAVTKFQILLHDLLLKHKASLLLYDEICHLFEQYISSLNFGRFAKLKSRRSLLTSTHKTLNSKALQPINGTVRLHNNSLVIDPVFDTKHMIISLLSDPSVMIEKNFAEGYNVLTGEVDNHPANYKYGEVHTGDAWLPAWDRYCQNKTDMPVELIVFGDKSHTDLHGALSLTPIIFTLTLFNCAAQNDLIFWRQIGYIPNLGYRRGTSNKTHTRDKIQDEHSCISFAFQSFKNIIKENGFQCVVLGHTVHVKVWIHYYIGDAKGNNKWLGQYPGNREGVRHPYRYCKCQFQDLSNPNPKCIYLTMADINFGKKRKQEDEDAGIEYYRSVSIYDIRNALTEKSLPLSDNINGSYKMMPPELLHTSGSGLIMYMFESLKDQMGGEKDRDLIDRQHIRATEGVRAYP